MHRECPPGAARCLVEEGKVERRVVGYDDTAVEMSNERVEHFFGGRGVSKRPPADAVNATWADTEPQPVSRTHEAGPTIELSAVRVDHDNSDLEQTMAFGRQSRRLDVDHRKAHRDSLGLLLLFEAHAMHLRPGV